MFAYLSHAMLLGDYTEKFAWFPESASTFAEDIDWLYGFITWICFIFFVLLFVVPQMVHVHALLDKGGFVTNAAVGRTVTG